MSKRVMHKEVREKYSGDYGHACGKIAGLTNASSDVTCCAKRWSSVTCRACLNVLKEKEAARK